MGMGGNNEASKCRSLKLDEQRLSATEKEHLEALMAARNEKVSADPQDK